MDSSEPQYLPLFRNDSGFWQKLIQTTASVYYDDVYGIIWILSSQGSLEPEETFSLIGQNPHLLYSTLRFDP